MPMFSPVGYFLDSFHSIVYFSYRKTCFSTFLLCYLLLPHSDTTTNANDIACAFSCSPSPCRRRREGDADIMDAEWQ